jgi:uncharacterized protein (DUF58 family)
MLPIPTATAVALYFATLACLVIGALSASLAAAVIGATGAIGLAAALAATMPVGRRVRRQRLEFAWWLAQGDPSAGGGAVVPGAPFEVRCYLRHRGLQPLVLTSLDPIVPGGATRIDRVEEADTLALAPASRTEFSFRLVAPAVGRVVLHGLAVTLQGPLGLFVVPLYFPNPLVIKVLPQAAARLPRAARAMPGLPVDRSGQSLLAPHGGGTELRELREMRPGDPFKSIAWKPSARRAKLLVREVEQEVQETRYVVLDVSGTMRGGEPGRRKLDHAIEATAAEARRTLAAGDRFGLITVDGRVLAHVPAQDGSAHLLRVLHALLAATEVVDQDLTDVDDDEVCAIVGRYVRQQDGVDFSMHPGGRRGRGVEWNVSLLVRHVSQALAAEQVCEEPVVASSPATAMLRRFCRVRGIPLPYRPAPRDGTKGPGLANALRDLAQRGLGPMSVIVVTDLDGVGAPDGLVSAVKLLRLRGHEVSFVVHHGPSFARPPRTQLEKDLFEVYARGERRRAIEMRALLKPLGVPLTLAHASDPPATLLWKNRGRLRHGGVGGMRARAIGATGG